MAALDPTLSGIIYTAVGGFVLAMGLAFAKTYGKHRQDARDAQGLREFFFDTPANDRTGVPAKKGWTTKVDETLNEILAELKPDHNGGHNLRGAVDRTAKKVVDP